MEKIWVTKYALTDGIREYEAEIHHEKGMAVVPKSADSFLMCFHGKDWHLRKEFALARAEEMRIRKLQSLDKQVKKISALKFD